MSNARSRAGLWAQASASRQGARARQRIGRAAAGWLGLTLVTIVCGTAVVIWHLVRRGRLIRDRLGPPRAVALEDLDVAPVPRSAQASQGAPDS